MAFSEDTMVYLQSVSGQAKEIANIIGVSDVTAQGMLGAIGDGNMFAAGHPIPGIHCQP